MIQAQGLSKLLAAAALVFAACTGEATSTLALPATQTVTSRPVPRATLSSPAQQVRTLQEFAGAVSSSAVAVSPDGLIVAAVNPDSDSVTLVDAFTLDVIDELLVGDDPRTLSFTPDSKSLLVANRGSGNISVLEARDSGKVTHLTVGSMPYGVVADGQRAYVAEFALGNVAVFEMADRSLVRRLPVGPFPAGLALLKGRESAVREAGILLVSHFFSGEVTVIDLNTLDIVTVASTGLGTNLSQSIAVAPGGAKAYLPQTRSNATNPALNFDTTVFPLVNVLDLSNYSLLPRQRITIDTADQPASIPFSAVVSPDGGRIYVVHAGSNDLSVIDLASNRGLANIGVGANPRGIALAPNGSRLFVNNTLDGTMTVVDTRTLAVTDTIPITVISLDPYILQGKKLFNSAAAPVLTTDQWISCAVCHFDGGMDGRTWQGFPDGPRNTPALFGVGGSLPIHWSGDLDELQDVELTIRNIQFGTGLVTGPAHDSLGKPHTGVSVDLDALAAYMNSLAVPSSPYPSNTAQVKAGRETFNSLGCQLCHIPPYFTDSVLHNVATGDLAKEKNSHGRGGNFDTPSLLGVWQTAPYFHDGSAATLEEVFQTGPAHDISGSITAEELHALIEYVRALSVAE